MRDTRRYPVTQAEVLYCLKELREEEMAKEAIGSMRPLLLQTAIDLLSKVYFPADAR